MLLAQPEIVTLRYLSVLMVDHNVMRFDVSVHDSLAVAVVQSLEQLQDVESHVKVVELRVQASEVGVVDILENQRRRLALQGTRTHSRVSRQLTATRIAGNLCSLGTDLGVSHDIKQRNDVGAARQILQDLDLSLDLLLLDGL